MKLVTILSSSSSSFGASLTWITAWGCSAPLLWNSLRSSWFKIWPIEVPPHKIYRARSGKIGRIGRDRSRIGRDRPRIGWDRVGSDNRYLPILTDIGRSRLIYSMEAYQLKKKSHLFLLVLRLTRKRHFQLKILTIYSNWVLSWIVGFRTQDADALMGQRKGS